jgi:hypothetical protein
MMLQLFISERIFLTQRCALVGFPDGLAHQDKERKGLWCW